MSFPPFAGATRKLILAFLAVFFGDAILRLVLPTGFYRELLDHLILVPADVIHGQIWQLVTYLFLPLDITGTLFALLTLWFIGSMLEDARGERWLYEIFFASAVGGAVLATLVSLTRVFGLSPNSVAIGPYGGIFGLLVAIAVLMGDAEFLLLFIVRIKAKYLVAIYILINIASLLKSANAFTALLQLCGGLGGFLYIRFAPRRGYVAGTGFSLSERFYAMRNEFYRRKRRNAAKKFEVYMRGQNREVHFDKDGRYVDPDERRDPSDRRWMN